MELTKWGSDQVEHAFLTQPISDCSSSFHALPQIHCSKDPTSTRDLMPFPTISQIEHHAQFVKFSTNFLCSHKFITKVIKNMSLQSPGRGLGCSQWWRSCQDQLHKTESRQSAGTRHPLQLWFPDDASQQTASLWECSASLAVCLCSHCPQLKQRNQTLWQRQVFAAMCCQPWSMSCLKCHWSWCCSGFACSGHCPLCLRSTKLERKLCKRKQPSKQFYFLPNSSVMIWIGRVWNREMGSKLF